MWFFFSSRRRHTRSLCDWSSDVCSSDLSRDDEPQNLRSIVDFWYRCISLWCARRQPAPDRHRHIHRSEERRVGKECRSRWSSEHEKKKLKLRLVRTGESKGSLRWILQIG